MPGFDGTGPRGQGARTGRGMGYCAPTSETTQQPVYGVGRGGFPRGGGRGFAFGGGRGFAFGRGRGRGVRQSMWMPAPPVPLTKTQEVAELQGQASLLQNELNQINARLEELSADTEKE